MKDTEQKKVLKGIKKNVREYLKSEFCEGDAAIVMHYYKAEDEVEFAIKGEYENVARLLHYALNNQPDFFEITKMVIKQIEYKNEYKGRSN